MLSMHQSCLQKYEKVTCSGAQSDDTYPSLAWGSCGIFKQNFDNAPLFGLRWFVGINWVWLHKDLKVLDLQVM